MRRLYPNTLSARVAALLGRNVGMVHQHAAKLGLKKTAEWKASKEACKLRRNPEVGEPHRFKKGLIPWNKGLKHPPGWSPGRMKETQFKKGRLNGHARQLGVPVGSTRHSKDGYLETKFREREGRYGNWKGVHILLWEDAHGPVPRGHKVAFRDGDRTHIALDNLELISDAEMMRRNTVHNLPKELAQVIQLAGALKRKVRTLSGVQREEGSGDAV